MNLTEISSQSLSAWKAPIPQVTSSTEGRSKVPDISVQNSPRLERLRPLPTPRSADIRKLDNPATWTS
jgi:hypothetical protein